MSAGFHCARMDIFVSTFRGTVYTHSYPLLGQGLGQRDSLSRQSKRLGNF